MDFLSQHVDRLSGLAIYNIFPDHPITQFLPESMSTLPILLVPPPMTPHEILAGIISEEISMFSAGGMVTAMSDLGIALDFSLKTHPKENKIPLGTDLFNTENQVLMTPLVDECTCFTCKKYHRAYIHHLLKCHEMTAWVLLQMYHSSSYCTNR
jgi:queuine tRNA-ribosyltransferase accessory subunit